eukprot:TRINITY_DN35286_c0_g2_i1.p1 TRINITY_DN35286_c0_g2~~TRINITY_DN35286_c0_g2_i1.p1  ORF type:complete len:495 (+),score=167.71 TRINITY_DN35286_c0_g2_i1:73-1485(+)
MLRRCRLALRCTPAPGAGVGVQRVTQLTNGARVVSFDELAPVSCIGLFTDAGCRYERDGLNAGCTALLESISLASNTSYTAAELQQFLFRHETGFGIDSHREVLVHRADCLRWEVEQMFGMLLSMLCGVRTDDDAMAEHRATLRESLENLRADPTKILFELMHRAAWNDQTLGRAHWPNPDRVDSITATALWTYLHTFVQPERIVVVSRGVEHEDMVRITEEKMKEAFQGWERVPLPDHVSEPSQYVGGERLELNLEAPPTREKFEEKNLTHAGIMYRGVPAGAGRDFWTTLTAQAMLGGGLSFSTGGPGKGMHTKLYREALCTHQWLDGIECITAGYTDGGLFGLYGHAPHEQQNDLLRLMAYQIATVPDRVTERMVSMARNQLKSQIFMAMEERAMSVDEIGRTLALSKKPWNPEEFKAEIDSITLADLHTAMQHFLSSPGTLAIYGNTEGAHSLSQLQTYINSCRSA